MINKFIRFCSFFSFFYLSATLSTAQLSESDGYTIRHYTDENGLPQNSINDLLFDDAGYLWLGSQVGLVRFNGQTFRLYYPSDKPMMESNVISLGKDGSGRIYFQTLDHNLYCYPGNNSHHLNPINSWDLADPRLLNGSQQLVDFTRFLQPGDGGANAERAGIFRELFMHNRDFYAIDSQHIYCRYHDSLYYYDGRRLLSLEQFSSEGDSYLVLGRIFYLLHRDATLSAWQEGRRIDIRPRIDGDLALSGRPHPRSCRLFATSNFTHILADHRLYRILKQPDGSLTSQFLVDLSFITNITAIEYNRELDLIVIATGTDGFYVIRKSRFLQSRFSPALQALLKHRLLGAMTLLDDRSVLTDQFYFDTAGSYQTTEPFAGPAYKCLYKDRNGFVWSAIHDLPRRMTRELRTIEVYPTLDARVVDFKEDVDGTLYCLTDKSLWRKGPGGFQRVQTSQPIVRGINETLCLDRAGHFLIGNTEGLISLDLHTGQLQTTPLLEGDHVRAIYRCRDSSVLIGTYGQGYFYRHGDRLYHMPLDKNGYLITAHSFLEDSKANIWIPCNKGLFRVPKTDLDAWCLSENSPIYYYYYGRQDGLPTNEFNGGYNSSGVITPNDFVALQTMDGMICYYTDSLRADFPHGGIGITRIEIDGQPKIKCDSIRLPPDHNNLLLEVSCPYLGNRANLYMDYRLKGLDSGWRQLPEDGILSLNRLAPGQYTLQVRKVNGFGKENYSYREWPVEVIPHVYQTTWFRTLIPLGILLLVLVLIRLSWTLKEKRREIRINTEKLKGAVSTLEDTVNKLQESEKALVQTTRLREKLISLVIHDLRSPLRFLTMLAADLHDNQDRLGPAEIKERSYWIKKGTQDIQNFSEDFLLWVTSQKDNFSIAKSRFPLQPLLQEIHDFFSDQVTQKGNTLGVDAPKDLVIFSDPHILITIIRNLVDNANKYTEKGTIRISAEQEAPNIVISVTDTGKGMSREQIDRFFRHQHLDNIQSGSQLGHKFVIDLTASLDGTVSIESKPGYGTTVSIRLPVSS